MYEKKWFKQSFCISEIQVSRYLYWFGKNIIVIYVLKCKMIRSCQET
jgi:hypothetical protein